MPLAPGAHLGPYEILAPLGAGGMGEVFRARDARLRRDVAIKVLPASFSSDPDRLRRFEQEAHAAGALSHANILAIYDIGTHEGSPFLVTELLDGETLRDRLQSGPLPVRKAIDIGIQVARGISAAHEKGIVHRDLKPANLFLTADGRMKILDFGLAKLKPENTSTGETQTPTKTVDAHTEPGMVLGTVGYMSPEQVRGKPADARSDIFSVGTILYEMLSGERPFQRGSSADTMAAILKEDPPELSNEGRKIPPGVERIVRHCLEKDPAERFQSARDLAFDLESLSETSTASAPRHPVARKLQPQKSLAPITAALVLLALGGVGTYFMGKRAGSNPPPTFHQLTFKRGLIHSTRFAPDGQTVIYSASWDGQAPQLYSTRPDAPESRPLEVRDSNLFAVSSTGQMAISLGCHRIVVIADCGGTLASMPFSGGAPRELAQDVISADWTADGNNLAVARRAAGKLGIEFPLGKRLYKSPGWLRSVRVSARGDAVAFVEDPASGTDSGSVSVLDMNGGQKLLSSGWVSLQGLGWSPRGDEVWIAGTKDHAWANEIHGLDLSGRDRVILRLPGIIRLHDISREGRVLLSSERWRYGILFRGPADEKERDLSWLDFSLVSDLSRDGRNLAFAENGEAAGTLVLAYMQKLDGSPPVRLGDCGWPIFSPDQKRILCESLNGDQLKVIATGAAESKSITPYAITQHCAFGWLPDGKGIFLQGYDGQSWRIYTQDLDGGKPRPVTPEILPNTEWTNLVSPDGKWIVGQDLEGKAWLYPVAGGSPHAVQGLEENEVWVNWSADGRSAYIYESGKVPTKIFRLDLSTGKKQSFIELSPGDLPGLARIRSVRVTPDGKSYAYTYERALSELYLVEGLK